MAAHNILLSKTQYMRLRLILKIGIGDITGEEERGLVNDGYMTADGKIKDAWCEYIKRNLLIAHFYEAVEHDKTHSKGIGSTYDFMRMCAYVAIITRNDVNEHTLEKIIDDGYVSYLHEITSRGIADARQMIDTIFNDEEFYYYKIFTKDGFLFSNAAADRIVIEKKEKQAVVMKMIAHNKVREGVKTA